jgi:hypothetical protein
MSDQPDLQITFAVELTEDQIREIANLRPETMGTASAVLFEICQEWVNSNGPAGIAHLVDHNGRFWTRDEDGNWKRPATEPMSWLEGRGLVSTLLIDTLHPEKP